MNGYSTTVQDPHAPVKMPSLSPSLPDEQTVKDDAELKYAITCIEAAKKARKPIDKEWPKLEAYYNGNQWYGKKRPSYRASPVDNKIRPAIQTILPIMTDAQPGVDVIPQEPSDYAFATSISEVVRCWWTRRSAFLILTEALLDALKFHGGILKIVYDPDCDNGRGDVYVVRIDPNNFWVADGAIDVNNNNPYTVEAYPARVNELKRKFPKLASQIRATGPRSKPAEEGGMSTDIIVVSPVDKATGPFPEGVKGISNSSDNDVVWVYEIWADDDSVEEVDGADGEKALKRKYPNGKIIQCVPDLNLLLACDDNPYKDGMKPYVRFINTLVPGRFWGEGEIEPYISAQDQINKTLATIYDCLGTMTNPVWIVDNESGVDPNMITNQIGLIIVKNRGGEVRREPAPSIPPDLFNFYTMMGQSFDSQSGVHDITQGRKPVGVTAAEAMNTMQEAAQTRIRLKERYMQSSLNQMGLMVVSRILQFYRKPRIVRITGNSNFPEYYEFYIEEIPDEQGGSKYRMNRRDYQYDDVAKKYTPSQQGYRDVGESKGLFDVQIMSGTSLPAMKAQRGNLALQLFDRKAIDQEALLDQLEIPQKEEIMSRMKQEAQAAAEAAQQGAGGPQK
jgi:hypothetical protein